MASNTLRYYVKAFAYSTSGENVLLLLIWLLTPSCLNFPTMENFGFASINMVPSHCWITEGAKITHAEISANELSNLSVRVA